MVDIVAGLRVLSGLGGKNEVTELGTHDELVAAGGTYVALWRSWHSDRRDESAHQIL